MWGDVPELADSPPECPECPEYPDAFTGMPQRPAYGPIILELMNVINGLVINKLMMN
jgi:hypothetical protein